MSPEFPRFRRELAAITPAPFAETCYRVVELEAFLNSVSPALLFDWGPKISRHGQRFSPPDSHRGLYVSTEVLTAGREFADGRASWLAGTRTKHIVFDMDVRLNAVLDLTLAPTRRALRTSRRELQSAWLGFAELNAGA